MIQFSRKRRTFRASAVYIAAAVMGMFSLSAVEPLRGVVFELQTVQDTIFDVSSAYITQDSTREEAVVAKINSVSFSPFRIGAYRAAFPSGAQSATANASIQPPFSIGAQTPIARFNNAVPLRLRI
jgi:hypothetical protein